MTRRILVALSSFFVVGCANPRTGPAKLPLDSCVTQGVDTARCGRLDVFENRESKSGRRIALRIVVLPAKETPLPDPVFVLSGGPGQAARVPAHETGA